MTEHQKLTSVGFAGQTLGHDKKDSPNAVRRISLGGKNDHNGEPLGNLGATIVKRLYLFQEVFMQFCCISDISSNFESRWHIVDDRRYIIAMFVLRVDWMKKNFFRKILLFKIWVQKLLTNPKIWKKNSEKIFFRKNSHIKMRKSIFEILAFPKVRCHIFEIIQAQNLSFDQIS